MLLKVMKMGTKKGIYIPKEAQKFGKGVIVLLKLEKEGNEVKFISKFNYNIVIRNEFVRSLNLETEDLVDIEITEICNMERSKNLFQDNKVDLLHLVPEKTFEGYEIIVNEFYKNQENWLRLWYSHERGSGRQVELRRFVNIRKFGSLLGQYQAEGTKHKNGKRFRTEFTNKLITEHNDFLDSMEELGLRREWFEANFYHSSSVEKEKVQDLIKYFEEKTKLLVINCFGSKTTKGIGFKLVYRNTIITSLVLDSMDYIRKKFSEEAAQGKEEKNLIGAFLSKLLTGDGSIEIRKRYINNFEVRMKITDGDKRYLIDYKAILENLGFSAYIVSLDVRAYCREESLFYLHSIDAFKGTNNWYKLLIGIELYSTRDKNNIIVFDELEKMKEKKNVADSLALLNCLKVKPNKKVTQ